MTKLTHFGFQQINENHKAEKVAHVFSTVAKNYDLMNDLMSGGLHRLWKAFAINQTDVKPGYRVLDVAGGTGDMAEAFAKQAGNTGEIWLTDINEAMLQKGRDRLLNKGTLIPIAVCDAEHLPFPDEYFDRVMVSFGLRTCVQENQAGLG